MLGPVALTRDEARTLQQQPLRPYYAELGISGTRLAGGFISGLEKNAALTTTQWAQTHEEMLRTDPACNSAMRALFQTLLSAKWRWQRPDNASPLASTAADFLDEAFGFGGKRGRLKGGWEAALASMLPFVTLGFRYLEEVYAVADGRVWLDRYADREPSAHQRWETDADGNLAAVVQTDVSGLRTGGQGLSVPANKLVLLTLDRTGQNYAGRGLLRPCWYYWKLKTHALDMLAIAAERFAVPTPRVRVNRKEAQEASGYDDAGALNTAIDNAKAQAKAYTSHELAYLTEVAGVTFDTFGADFDPARLIAVVDHCDQQIYQAFLLGFMRLGVNDTGSRAVGEVQETFFRRAGVNILDYVAQVIGGPAGPGMGTAGRLLRWNFPSLPESEYPRLVHEGLTPSPLLAQLPNIIAAKGAGLLTWTREDEQDLRGANGQRPLPDDVPSVDAQAAQDPVGALAEAMRRARI